MSPKIYTHRLSSFLFLKKDSLEYMSRKMLRSEIYPESWNIIFHRSTCGAMFFTDVLHRCWGEVKKKKKKLTGKKKTTVEKKKKKINGKVKNYGGKKKKREERKYRGRRYLLFSPRTKGRYYPFDLKLDRWKAVVAPLQWMCFTMQKTIFDYVNRYTALPCVGKLDTSSCRMSMQSTLRVKAPL